MPRTCLRAESANPLGPGCALAARVPERGPATNPIGIMIVSLSPVCLPFGANPLGSSEELEGVLRTMEVVRQAQAVPEGPSSEGVRPDEVGAGAKEA